MPQAREELRNKFMRDANEPGGFTDGIAECEQIIRNGGLTVTNGMIRDRRDVQMTDGVREAIEFLCNEWDYGFLQPVSPFKVPIRPADFNTPREKQDSFARAATPLINWIQTHGHPHMMALVGGNTAELLESQLGVVLTSRRDWIRSDNKQTEEEITSEEPIEEPEKVVTIIDRSCLMVTSSDPASKLFYVSDPADVLLLPGVIAALKLLSRPVVMVMRQSALGSRISRDTLDMVNRHLEDELGFKFDGIYVETMADNKGLLFQQIAKEYGDHKGLLFDTSALDCTVGRSLGIHTYDVNHTLYDAVRALQKAADWKGGEEN